MVVCQLCQKEFKRITRTHLQLHNLTTDQYQLKFPGHNIISEELRSIYGKKFRENNPMKNNDIRQIISNKRTGMRFTEEHRKNISLARSGKSTGPRSDETKNKISVANKKTYQIKKDQGYCRPEYKMSPEALARASLRMTGNTIGKKGHHNKGKVLNLSIEQRKNRSLKRVEYLASNRTIKSGTRPENQFINFLVENSIEYQHQYAIHTTNGSWLYDFFLPRLNLLVEIDGEFWHSTKQSIRRDEIKNNVAKEQQKCLVRISTDNMDFSIIFNDTESIWRENILILTKRKQKNDQSC